MNSITQSLFSLGLRLCNLIIEWKLDIGQGAREAVKVDKKKIQSSEKMRELWMGSYIEALSLNWCDLRPDESSWSPKEFIAVNHSSSFNPLYPVVPQSSINKPHCALSGSCPDFDPAPASQNSVSKCWGVNSWERHPCLWTCCGCRANGYSFSLFMAL